MRECLLWWRDKPISEKKEIMKQHNVTVVTFEFIKLRYLESK